MKNSIHAVGVLCAVGAALALLPSLAGAQHNTSFGTGALVSITTGDLNSAFGYNALNLNDTGNENTAVGGGALEAKGGLSNTAVGVSAQVSNTSGSVNTTAQVQRAAVREEQIQALAARLVQLEATVSGHGHAPALEVIYQPQSGF